MHTQNHTPPPSWLHTAATTARDLPVPCAASWDRFWGGRAAGFYCTACHSFPAHSACSHHFLRTRTLTILPLQVNLHRTIIAAVTCLVLFNTPLTYLLHPQSFCCQFLGRHHAVYALRTTCHAYHTACTPCLIPPYLWWFWFGSSLRRIRSAAFFACLLFCKIPALYYCLFQGYGDFCLDGRF